MKYEEEIRGILLNILGTGLLRIRAFGWNGDAANCAIEADHLHNLPKTAREPTLKFLAYYYNVSRQAFITEAKDTRGFEADWERLGAILAKLQEKRGLSSIFK